MKIFRFSLRENRPANVLADAGDAARDRGDWREAVLHYRASLARDPARAELWVQLGHALKESGDLPGAATAYGTALEQAPKIADTHLQLGHLLKVSGRTDEAASAYVRALELDPSLQDALGELRALLRNGAKPDRAIAADLMPALRHSRRHRPAEDEATPQGDDRPTAVFDVSDLISYFHNARLPTGIQRVQIEVIAALLRDPPDGTRITVCAFTTDRDDWVALPADLFLDAAHLALAGGGQRTPDWRAVLDDIALTIELSPRLEFPTGAWLINLGTSWWLQNYFLKVREARRLYGVRYLPFVHDLIPVMAPEHCTRPLTQDFVSWVLGVFAHTDRFLTNSEASRQDLITVADRLGYSLRADQIQVVRLDGDFRKPDDDRRVAAAMERYGLEPGGFVLFVSTIESRKNHLAAFRAWRELITRYGASAIPKLVCVGNRGWLNDGVFARLDSDPELKRHVQMLSGVSDRDLAGLYQASAFTLYPSQYEGWGLPVTESLSYGKVVLASDSSSLPEAGGAFAVYFRQGDQNGLVEALERLILDLPYRRSLETRIAAGFRPRPWRALAADIIAGIASGHAPVDPDPIATPTATRGHYYWLRRSCGVAVGPGIVASEIFRSGGNWCAPQDWGCWTRDGDARIEARIETPSDKPLRLFIGLRGRPGYGSVWRLEVAGTLLAKGRLAPDEIRWVTRTIAPNLIRDGIVGLRIASIQQADAATPPDPGRETVGVIGFMLCDASDREARSAFVEALATGDLAGDDPRTDIIEG